MVVSAKEIVAWALRVGLEGLGKAQLTAGYCDRLVEAGIPLWRFKVGSDTLHPLLAAQAHVWLADEGVREDALARGNSTEREVEWLNNPWSWMLENNEQEMRARLALDEGPPFPLLAELAGQGATDYFARLVRFRDEIGIGEAPGLAMSWTTRAPGGFTEEDLWLIRETLPAVALCFKAAMALEAARTIVTTYLGRDAADRILRGEIERGKVETVRKTLWFSDLTGFTKIVDSLPREQLLELLNEYTDVLVGVINDHGGDVLKFMGDGILAVFNEAKEAVCRQVLDAAEAAESAVAKLNRERSASGRPVTGFKLALHEGQVLYGNVGSRERLDFTVVGPAVNEISRIEAMSRSLDQPVLISASFANACGNQRGRLVSVGRYALRGVGRPQELFTLDWTRLETASPG